MAPIIPIAMALAPAIASLIPSLAGALGGDRAEDVAQRVVDVAQRVTGLSEPTPAAVTAALSDPANGLEFAKIQADLERARDEQITARLKADAEDRADARRTMLALHGSGSPLAWGAAVVSFVVLVAFGAVSWRVMTTEIPPQSHSIALYVIGALQTLATAVVAYWVGSSAGSAQKTNLLARQDSAGPFVGRG